VGYGLVVEIPTDAHVYALGIDGIARSPEVSTVGLVGMIVLNIESCALQVEVGVYTHDGVVAHFHLVVGVLHHVLAHDGRVVGSVVLGEVFEVGTQFYVEHVSISETYVHVMI